MTTQTASRGSATDKQVSYAKALLAKAGRRTDFMDRNFSDLATMRERTGTVDNWLRTMDRQRISQIIDKLVKG